MTYRITTVMGREPNGTRAYHLAKGRGEPDWQEIWCGGGVAFPGWRQHVPPEDVCPACSRARREAAS